jgi:hypothetical protein
MLQDLDKTLERLIVREGKLPSNDIDISFEQPNREWSARLSKPTLDCYAFDLRENVKLRPNVERQVTRNGNQARLEYPSRRIDVTYLVTAWARRIEDEHQLLWRALGALKRNPLLDPATCEGDMRLQTRPVPLKVADMSELTTNILDLWGVLDNQLRLGFLVVATLELDVMAGYDAPLVLEASLRVGQAPALPARHLAEGADTITIKPKTPSGEEAQDE